MSVSILQLKRNQKETDVHGHMTLTLYWLKVISACTSIPDHVTLASSNTGIWPFQSPVISTFHKVWSHMIAYWGNSKIRLRQAVD